MNHIDLSMSAIHNKHENNLSIKFYKKKHGCILKHDFLKYD